MSALPKTIKSPTFVFFSCLLAISLTVGILSKSYFTVPVFYMDHNKYTFHSGQDGAVTYHSRYGPPVQVSIADGRRTVSLEGQEYVITETSSEPTAKYNVTYPGGQNYEVQDQSGHLIAFDEHGELVSGLLIYTGDQRVLQDGEEVFTPHMLVTAAYPQYHFTPGTPAFLYFALAGIIYGWCGFRYRKFQDILFLLSLRWVWVNDPEPSDFYYFMCKVGGIGAMIISLFLAVKAF
ncbi:MAG: hypothetical protein K0R57_4067 [Paenibacillaceae bacterium]|nr:hypothetical protein [Paenibacillaceae bacterium]